MPSHLKADLQRLRKRGAYKPGLAAVHQPQTSRICERCLRPLGLLTNRGAQCPSCRKKVCAECRFATKRSNVSDVEQQLWLCLVCHKQM